MPNDGVILHGITVIEFHDAVQSIVGDVDVGGFLMMALIEIESGLNIVDELGGY